VRATSIAARRARLPPIRRRSRSRAASSRPAGTRGCRAFAYLPFEHDESVESQREAVRLCAGIRDEAGCESYHRFALLHAAVVERFGRFPHRNAILGRASTDEETAFLREPGSSF
jgi:uncharacterized protein (DUF924 family)